jgi:SAM-dependent methyltransferase
MILQNFYSVNHESGLDKGQEEERIKTFWTEDMFFFHLAEKVGWKVFADSSIDLKHYEKNQRLVFDIPVASDVVTKVEPWNQTPLVCNLGAGLDCNPFEINVDLREDPRVFTCDVRQLPAEWEGLFDVVKAHHVLEHVPFADTDKVLKEWIRIVKPGGLLQLKLPDLQYAAELMKDGALDNWLLGLIYGDQGHEMWAQDPYGGEINGTYRPWSFENNCHKSGFTVRSILARLEFFGMEYVESQRDRIQFTIVVRKPKPDGKIPSDQGNDQALPTD